MTWRKIAQILHLALVLAAIFALTAFGVLLVRANQEMTRVNDDMAVIESQSKEASHTLGIILLKAAVVTDQAAKLAIVEQSYWREQNKQMGQLFETLNRSAQHFDETVVSLNGTIQTGNVAIKDFQGRADTLLDDASGNLQTLAENQAKFNQSIEALDLPSLRGQIGQISAQGVEISKNLNATTAHVDKVSADMQIYSDKFVAPKTKWQEVKSFMGLFMARALAYAVGNHL